MWGNIDPTTPVAFLLVTIFFHNDQLEEHEQVAFHNVTHGYY